MVFLGKSNNTHVQFVRYGFVACAAFAVDFVTYWALFDMFGVHKVLAATVGFVLGLGVNYLLSIAWVFTERTTTPKKELFIFTGIGLIGLAFTDGIIWLVAIYLQQNAIAAKLLATVIVFFWNFGARKLVLFNNNRETSWQNNQAPNKLP